MKYLVILRNRIGKTKTTEVTASSPRTAVALVNGDKPFVNGCEVMEVVSMNGKGNLCEAWRVLTYCDNCGDVLFDGSEAYCSGDDDVLCLPCSDNLRPPPPADDDSPIVLPFTGLELIGAERRRQVMQEGYDAAHDDSHTDSMLARVAAGLAIQASDCRSNGDPRSEDHWGLEAKHCGNKVRMLTIAGALIAAEIDRLNRIEETNL